MLVGSSNLLSIICSTFKLGSLSVGPVVAGRALVLCVIGGGGGLLLLLEVLEVLEESEAGLLWE
jgi:hypothetical protein